MCWCGKKPEKLLVREAVSQRQCRSAALLLLCLIPPWPPAACRGTLALGVPYLCFSLVLACACAVLGSGPRRFDPLIFSFVSPLLAAGI